MSKPTLPRQPSEPRFLANVRRYFADFPYLHSSIGQRLLTLETWCGYGYDQEWLDTRPHTVARQDLLPLVFKDQTQKPLSKRAQQ